MPNILVQFADVIKGCFTAFDRMIFRGRIMPLCTDSGATSYALNGAKVLFKDWKEYSEKITGEIISHAEKTCAGLGRPFINLDTQEERRFSRCLVSKNGRMIISLLIQMMAVEQAKVMSED